VSTTLENEVIATVERALASDRRASVRAASVSTSFTPFEPWCGSS
jgi:hypothetical protein